MKVMASWTNKFTINVNNIRLRISYSFCYLLQNLLKTMIYMYPFSLYNHLTIVPLATSFSSR